MNSWQRWKLWPSVRLEQIFARVKLLEKRGGSRTKELNGGLSRKARLDLPGR